MNNHNPQPNNSLSAILAIDIGAKRIGLALANRIAKLASPLTTLANDTGFKGQLMTIIEENNVDTLVVGLPRNLDGRDTAQTRAVRQFVEALQLDLPIVFQDEALTSQQAEAGLRQRKRGYNRGDVDAEAAAIILTDYLGEL